MIYLFLNIFILGFVFAQDPECPDELPDIATKTKFQNCASTQAKEMLTLKPADTSSLCSCAKNLKDNKKIFKMAVDESPLNIKEKLEGELLKALTDNLINVTKLKPLPGVRSFPLSTKGCDIEGFLKNSGCNNFSTNLKKKLAEELGNLLSSKPQRNDLGAMNRSSRAQNSCDISDSLIMQANSNLLNSMITSDLIKELKDSSLKSSSDIKNILDKKSLYSLFQNHPIFSTLIRKPEKFSSFFSSIQLPVSNINAVIYENEELDKSVDQEIANNCTAALDAYKGAACTNKDSSKINFSSLSETPSLFDSNTFVYDEDDDIDFEDPNMVNANNQIVKFCATLSSDKSALKISDPFLKINAQVSDAFKEKSYDDYKTGKYSFDFESQRMSICSQPVGCKEDSQACKLANIIRKSQKEGTEENRLASSSDEGLRKLLRSFVGETANPEISANTQQVLISQGIWPKPDGTYTPQKKVAERERKFYSEQAAAERSSSPSATTQAAQAAAIAQPSAPRRAAANSNVDPIVPQSSPNSLPSTTASTVAQASTFDADMDELKRKVAQLKSEGNSPAGQAVRKPAVSPRQVSQGSQTSLAASGAPASFSSGDDSDTTQAASGLENFGTTPDNRDTRDASQLQNQRSYADRQKALSGMAGAKGGSGRSPAGSGGAAGAEGGKAEATLTVTVPEEKLRSEITKILNVNELKNLETLAQSRKDFTFKINEAVFQIKFNPSTRLYAVEVASSRNEITERLKSDLVDYLNKPIKRTNSLDDLNKNFQ